MNIFVAASYSSQVNYETGEVFAEYKRWLETVLHDFENGGHTVFCALRADQYKINDADPAAGFSLDMREIGTCDALVALLTDKPSAGVQTEIGAAIALKKEVYLVHLPEDELSWFNKAILKSGVAKEILLPLNAEVIRALGLA